MPAPVASPVAFTPVRRFLGWDRPLLTAVIDEWTADWDGRVMDLSDRLVVVPTRQSGRRLREALAERAAARGAGVFPPRVLTTEALMNELRPSGLPVATAIESVLAWAAVLGGVSPGDFGALFPQVPSRPDFQWALRVAHVWQDVRRTLGEGGLSMESAASQLVAERHPEAARWADLARLEALYFRRLADGGREDAQVARRRTAVAPRLPPGVARLDVVAVSDPLDVAVQAMGRLGACGLPVTVWVAAPEERAEAFDGWGRPDPEAWSGSRDLPLELSQVHLAAGPVEQAERLRALAIGHADPAGTLGVGVADPEVAAALMATNADGLSTDDGGGLVCHLPDGEPGSAHELWHVLAGAVRLGRERSFRALSQWLRFPPVAVWLKRRAGLEKDVTQAKLISACDDFAATHLPHSLADGRAFGESTVAALTEAAESLLDAFDRRPLPEAVAGFLSDVYAGRTFSQAAPGAASFVVFAREFAETVRQAEAAATLAGISPTSLDLLGVVLEQLRHVRLDPEERPAAAVDVNGWLEIAWHDASHLILAGLNDGVVPEVIVGDAYLPESLRRHLGLRRTNAARLARDAHQLHALLASRQAVGGRVDVVLGRQSAAGDALRPSRLLFLRPDGELPARAAALFGADRVPDPPPPPAWRAAWRFRVPPPRAFERLSVTALRDYLACPFRFFLRHGLHMEDVEPEPRELDARAFGLLCHGALKALATDPAMRVCADEDVVAGYLRERVQQAWRDQCGTRLTVPLRIQLAAAEKRLAAFAAWQVQSVRDGWETIHAEVPFSELIGAPFVLGGLEIGGRIDRVDARGTERRILDFKTSDSPRPVAEAHLGGKLSAARLAEGWSQWQLHHNEDGHTFAWRDLQLPLYALAARHAWSCVPEVGYFHLAKAAADCAYEAWTKLTPALLADAEACAVGVVEAICRQEFWPPREVGRHDNFAWMFPGGVTAAVDPSALLPSS